MCADSMSMAVCYFDTFYTLSNVWIFGKELCGILAGFSSFTSTLTTYLLLTMNLHAISTANLALDALRIIKNGEEKCNFINEEVESSSVSDTYDTLEQKRTLTIDYSSGPNWKTKINVAFPNVIILILALSVSIPAFIFSTLKCDICINHFSLETSFAVIGILLAFIKIIIPSITFVITILILINKRKLLSKFEENYFIDENPISIIRTTLSSSALFLIFQFPKIFFENLLLHFEAWQFFHIYSYYITCGLCMIYYMGIFVRSLVCNILNASR